MKNKNTTTYFKESITALTLIILLVCIVNPFNMYMLSMFENVILGSIFVVFALFASFFLREVVVDERDEVHRSLSGRVAFLVGSAVLLLGITVQIEMSHLDIWLVVTLVAMILAKLIARIYSENRF
jgi:hypothetical protein